MKTIKTGKLYRNIDLNRDAIDLENRSVSLSFSSEEPVERFFGTEVLDHNESSIRLGRLRSNGPLLLEHDPTNQIGAIDNVQIGLDKVARADVRFSKSLRAQEIFQDVQDGIRKSISVGYQIHQMEKDEDGTTFRATDWEPLEISLVSIPADTSVGVGRSLEDLDFETKIKESEIIKMETTQEPKQTTVNVEHIQNEARTQEQNRIREITAMGKQFHREQLANQFIESGKSVEDFRTVLLENLGAEPIVKPNPDIGLNKQEIQRFSFLKAIRAAANSDWSEAGFEKECSDAVEKKTQKTRSKAGFYVPHEVLKEKRDLTVGTDADGGYLVATDLMSQSFIEMLRNAMMVKQLGATVMDGLVGNVAIPKQSGGATAYWISSEGGAITESQQTLAQVSLTPKQVGAYTDMSHKLMIQSSIDMEQFVRQDLALTLAIAMDLAAINGSGSSGQPTGVMQTSGIGSVAGGTNGLAPTYSHMVNLEKEVSKDNALLGSLGYLTNADVVAKLKTTEKASNTAQFIWENGSGGMGSVNGYRAAVSNQVPNNLTKGSSSGICSAIIFGNWRDLIIANWGTADVLVDPYTGSTTGTVRVRMLMDTDINVRHAESFASMQDALTS